jgi:hypothetical protein
MATAISPTAGRRYGVARVCAIRDVLRSSFHAARRPRADTAGLPAPAPRRGPKPTGSEELLGEQAAARPKRGSVAAHSRDLARSISIPDALKNASSTSGSPAARASHSIRPASLTLQIAVSSNDTSKPTR